MECWRLETLEADLGGKGWERWFGGGLGEGWGRGQRWARATRVDEVHEDTIGPHITALHRAQRGRLNPQHMPNIAPQKRVIRFLLRSQWQPHDVLHGIQDVGLKAWQ